MWISPSRRHCRTPPTGKHVALGPGNARKWRPGPPRQHVKTDAADARRCPGECLSISSGSRPPPQIAHRSRTGSGVPILEIVWSSPLPIALTIRCSARHAEINRQEERSASIGDSNIRYGLIPRAHTRSGSPMAARRRHHRLEVRRKAREVANPRRPWTGERVGRRGASSFAIRGSSRNIAKREGARFSGCAWIRRGESHRPTRSGAYPGGMSTA